MYYQKGQWSLGEWKNVRW